MVRQIHGIDVVMVTEGSASFGSRTVKFDMDVISINNRDDKVVDPVLVGFNSSAGMRDNDARAISMQFGIVQIEKYTTFERDPRDND